jgi:hypothetical protein
MQRPDVNRANSAGAPCPGVTVVLALALMLARVCTAAEPASAMAVQQPCPPVEAANATDVPRRRPGEDAPTAPPATDCGSARLPRVEPGVEPALVAAPDRWRAVEKLGYRVDWLDAYHGNNALKGDRPIAGRDRFLSLGAVSSTLIEARHIPTTTAGTADAQGARGATRDELFYNQSLSIDAVLYRGDTTFRPPDWQWRLTAVATRSGTRAGGQTASASSASVQALWYEKHLRNVSANYDFDSVRLGIQPLTSDFRGFLLSDQPLALRLFGTRHDNVLQYNLAFIRRLQKNRVRLNDIAASLPRNDVLLANLYWQDFPRAGVTSEFVAAYSRSREPGPLQLLVPGVPNAPAHIAAHDYDVGYLGYGFDGHFGWLNATAMVYGLSGHERQSPFTGVAAQVRAWFAASEWSVDSDRRRWRLSLLHASGDRDPQDHDATGFDGLNASPEFAGTDSSEFIHQRLALAGGAFDLKARDALLPALRSAADGGQANFSNPGLNLAGLGLDYDASLRWRLSFDANQLWFDQPAVLAALAQRPLVDRRLGAELAVNVFWRPWANQNLIARLSGSWLMRGPGYRELYDGGNPYSTFAQLVFSY